MMAWCSSSDATEDDHTYIGVLGFESQLQFSPSSKLLLKYILGVSKGSVVVSLPPTWVTQIQFLAPGLGLAYTQLMQVFRD